MGQTFRHHCHFYRNTPTNDKMDNMQRASRTKNELEQQYATLERSTSEDRPSTSICATHTHAHTRTHTHTHTHTHMHTHGCTTDVHARMHTQHTHTHVTVTMENLKASSWHFHTVDYETGDYPMATTNK